MITHQICVSKKIYQHTKYFSEQLPSAGYCFVKMGALQILDLFSAVLLWHHSTTDIYKI